MRVQPRRIGPNPRLTPYGSRPTLLCMGVRLIIAVTDGDWFETLRHKQNLSEVNFWSPSAARFKALRPGEIFLFKLHSPRNFIVGGGVFAYASQMPVSLAWQAFGEANGAASLGEVRSRVARYRRQDPADRSDFQIGCRILTQPFFLEERDWLPVPASWQPNIVQFKTYDTAEVEGAALWDSVSARMTESAYSGMSEEAARFGAPQLIRPRLGQGAFRVLVTDSYERRCAITREKTLPALEAAHIRPYAEGGEHVASNGLLLRRDIHSLFDSGYVTVTHDLRFEVSRRIREEFQNGRHYYELHGAPIHAPEDLSRRPDPAALRWHNDNLFLA